MTKIMPHNAHTNSVDLSAWNLLFEELEHLVGKFFFDNNKVVAAQDIFHPPALTDFLQFSLRLSEVARGIADRGEWLNKYPFLKDLAESHFCIFFNILAEGLKHFRI